MSLINVSGIKRDCLNSVLTECIFHAESKYDNENFNFKYFFKKLENFTCLVFPALDAHMKRVKFPADLLLYILAIEDEKTKRQNNSLKNQETISRTTGPIQDLLVLI